MGRYSAPTFADIDGDGDQDLVVGESDGNLNYYENTGTASAPVYTVRTGTANPFNGIDVGVASAPSFADTNGDGLLDLIIGESAGNLNYYENTGTASAPVYTVRTGTANPFNGINVGTYSTPSFADINGDGDQDLVVGESNGTLRYYENTGTTSDPDLHRAHRHRQPVGTASMWGPTPPRHLRILTATAIRTSSSGKATAPCVTMRTRARLRTPSTPRALAPPTRGMASMWELSPPRHLRILTATAIRTSSSGTSTATCVTMRTRARLRPDLHRRTGTANPFNGIDVGLASVPTFADIDGDGDHRRRRKRMRYYEHGHDFGPIYTVRTTANPWDGIDVGTTFADIDGDGDQDLVVGESNGTLRTMRTRARLRTPTYTVRTGTANPWDGVDVGDFLHPDICGY